MFATQTRHEGRDTTLLCEQSELLMPYALCLKLTTPLSLRDISPVKGRYKAVEMKTSYLHSSNIRAKRNGCGCSRPPLFSLLFSLFSASKASPAYERGYSRPYLHSSLFKLHSIQSFLISPAANWKRGVKGISPVLFHFTFTVSASQETANCNFTQRFSL